MDMLHLWDHLMNSSFQGHRVDFDLSVTFEELAIFRIFFPHVCLSLAASDHRREAQLILANDAIELKHKIIVKLIK